MLTPRVLSDHRDQVGECPLWDGDAQALYWVDINGCHIHRLDWASGVQQTWNTPQRVGCIALSARGGLVAALETGIYAVTLLEPPALQLTCLAPISHPRPHMRFNDGRCDALGRLWVSTSTTYPHAYPGRADLRLHELVSQHQQEAVAERAGVQFCAYRQRRQHDLLRPGE